MKKPLKGELIGLKLRIISSKNKSNVGIRGKVVDETKNTLVVEENNHRKILIKGQNEFKFEKQN